MTSIDLSTAKSGLALLPQIAELQKEVLGRRLRLGAWIDLGIAGDMVGGLSRATEGLPKMVRGDLQKWIDIFEVVGAFRKVESISLQIIDGPELVDLRFHLLNEE